MSSGKWWLALITDCWAGKNRSLPVIYLWPLIQKVLKAFNGQTYLTNTTTHLGVQSQNRASGTRGAGGTRIPPPPQILAVWKAKPVPSKYLVVLIAPPKFFDLPTALQTVVDHRFRVRSDFTPSSAVCIAYAHFLGLSVTKQRVLWCLKWFKRWPAFWFLFACLCNPWLVH